MSFEHNFSSRSSMRDSISYIYEKIEDCVKKKKQAKGFMLIPENRKNIKIPIFFVFLLIYA